MKALLLMYSVVCGASCIAATCPNLSGFYESDGEVMQIAQDGCKGMKVRLCSVRQDTIDCKPSWLTWPLNGQLQSDLDSTFNSNSIIVTEKTASTIEGHGVCRSNGFTWSLDNKGNLVHTDFATSCDDGFEGKEVEVKKLISTL